MQSLAKRKKYIILHILNKTNTHISGCKSVHKCTTATVTMHICMVTVAFAFFFSLSTSLSIFLSGLTLHLIRVPSLSQQPQQLNKEEEDKYPTIISAQPNHHLRNPNLPKNPFQIQTKINKN